MIIIFVSHSMEDVAKTAEHIVVMNNGRIAMTGGVKEVFSRGRELEEMGLSVPQITKLCARLSSAGINIEQGIFTVEEAVEKLAAAMNL